MTRAQSRLKGEGETICRGEASCNVSASLTAIQYRIRDLGLEKPKMDIAFIPILCSAPLLYAQTHGYFAWNGLDVTLTPAPGWSGVKDLLAFGHTDAAHLLSPMPLAMRQGLDGRRAEIRLACIQNVNGQALTLAKKHAGVKDVREMKGFTFGVPYRFSMHYYLLCLFLAEHGLDPLRDVSILEVSPPRMPHFIETGRVDGVFAPSRSTRFRCAAARDSSTRCPRKFGTAILAAASPAPRSSSASIPRRTRRCSEAFWRRSWPCTRRCRASDGKSRSN